MKLMIALISLLFSTTSLASLPTHEPLTSSEREVQDIINNTHLRGSYQNNKDNTLIFLPQANTMKGPQAPIYFHYKSNPTAICKSYQFNGHVEGSVVYSLADFNYNYIIVNAYEFTANQLRFTIPNKSMENENHLKLVSEITCY